MRESVPEKARRYVGEGRLIVEYCAHAIDGGTIRATCRGDGDVYTVTFDNAGWRCTCPARGHCAHLAALGLVVAPGRGEAFDA